MDNTSEKKEIVNKARRTSIAKKRTEMLRVMSEVLLLYSIFSFGLTH